MADRYNIAGYARISVDEELDRDNTSIENQKAIIQDYAKAKFPNSNLTFYQDRDRSGYTFEQREGYQSLRPLLMNHTYDILLVKDFSRFSRRNSRGLVELEDLRDAGVRIISISDNIDFPTYDDWVSIQFRFLVNEMPVTDTSKKIKAVIKSRESRGEWICSAPYGYILNKKSKFEIVPEEAEVVRMVFKFYTEDGWGYNRIAKYLTDEGFLTPRMAERERAEKEDREFKKKSSPNWSTQTIHGMLSNDFYIGTLRQHKSSRVKINGRQKKTSEQDHVIFEHDHQPIVDFKTFALAKRIRDDRNQNAYRGIKKYNHVYTGLLWCGDCGNRLVSISSEKLSYSYHCGLYHKQGSKACTSHYVRADVLDKAVKAYILKLKENCSDMIEQLNKDIQNEKTTIAESDTSVEHLEERVAELRAELKATKRQRVKDIAKHPEQEEILDETYDELENDIINRIESVQKQISLMEDKRNTAIRVNRIAKTAFDVFDDILAKEKLDKTDITLLVQKIVIYQDHIEIALYQDVETILRTGTLESEEANVNFNQGTNDNLSVHIVIPYKKRDDEVISVNVISNGLPSLTTLTLIDRFTFSMIDLSTRLGWLC